MQVLDAFAHALQGRHAPDGEVARGVDEDIRRHGHVDGHADDDVPASLEVVDVVVVHREDYAGRVQRLRDENLHHLRVVQLGDGQRQLPRGDHHEECGHRHVDHDDDDRREESDRQPQAVRRQQVFAGDSEVRIAQDRTHALERAEAVERLLRLRRHMQAHGVHHDPAAADVLDRPALGLAHSVCHHRGGIGAAGDGACGGGRLVLLHEGLRVLRGGEHEPQAGGHDHQAHQEHQELPLQARLPGGVLVLPEDVRRLGRSLDVDRHALEPQAGSLVLAEDPEAREAVLE
mmetsp:Transcript_109704/g.341920  ORF Transcript_109704/g.341920 Transcript_109704/m.341920 type:complete len:289 (-) Transcript_109704:552-1418(-)